MVVNEDNALYRVNLYDYLDTGLFLDGRIIRKMIRDEAKGKDVLNLFSYTCTASVAAALGGAKSTVSVDMSKTYLEWGIENFKQNALSLENSEFIQADCLSWLSSDHGRLFDLIYIDPPTFSNSKRMETSFDVKRDHVALLSNLIRHLKDGGKVIFCTNHRGFKLDEESLLEYGFEIKDISKTTLPRDFKRNEKIHSCYTLVYSKQNQKKEISPMVSVKSAPKWQKTLNEKPKSTYHSYSNTTKTSRDDDFSNERTNRVWGSAAKSVNPRSNRSKSDRQSFKNDFKKPSDRQNNVRRKPRVFGPDGVKDI